MSTEGVIRPNNAYDMYKDIIDKNESVTALLQFEKNRLQEKKEVIDDVYFTHKRKQAQIKDDMLRRKAYNNMYLTSMLIIVVSLLLATFNNIFGFVSSTVVSLLIILIVGGGIILLIRMYLDIRGRDKLNFEQVDISNLLEPSQMFDENSNQLSALVENKDHCVGNDCCPEGMFFVDNECSKCDSTAYYSVTQKKCIQKDDKKDVDDYINSTTGSAIGNLLNLNNYTGQNLIESFYSKPEYSPIE